MADWSSTLDSGVNSAVVNYRWHAVGVRVGMKVGFRGYVNINRWGLGLGLQFGRGLEFGSG